jgi:hypothetical protein
MPTASYNKFNQFVQKEGTAVFNLGTDVLKVMLVNSPAPVATNAVKADLTEIGAGNGYSAGGFTPTGQSYTNSSGTSTMAANAFTLTASGGTIGPFRYAVLYDSTASGGPLIAWWDYGTNLTLNDGDALQFTPTGNVLFTEA